MSSSTGTKAPAPAGQYHGKVKISDLTIDHRVQREDLNSTKIDKMVSDFDPRLLGVVIVSKRANGTQIVLDGWHRSEVCKLVPTAPTELDAIIHTGLTLADEAHLFRLYNFRTSLRVTDTFRAEVQEGVTEAVIISNMVGAYGMEVRRGSFAAVAAARRILRMKDGASIFERTLDIINRAFTLDRYSSDYRVITGIAEMLNHYPRLDADRLVARLAELKESVDPTKPQDAVALLVKKAKLYHDNAQPGAMYISMCTVMVPMYNKGLRTGSAAELPPYSRRTRGAKLDVVAETEA